MKPSQRMQGIERRRAVSWSLLESRGLSLRLHKRVSPFNGNAIAMTFLIGTALTIRHEVYADNVQ
jgi:hypothetical protein